MSLVMKPSLSQSRFNRNGSDESDDRTATVAEKTVVRKAHDCVTEAMAQRRRRTVLLLLTIVMMASIEISTTQRRIQ